MSDYNVAADIASGIALRAFRKAWQSGAFDLDGGGDA
jgi:hypothetical protein